MTIVEFLTARYDELEAGIREGLRTEEHGISEFDLADVASKRAIVAEYERIALSAETYPNAPNFSSLIAMTTVARLLAQPFVEHPDYDPAWAVEVHA